MDEDNEVGPHTKGQRRTSRSDYSYRRRPPNRSGRLHSQPVPAPNCAAKGCCFRSTADVRSFRLYLRMRAACQVDRDAKEVLLEAVLMRRRYSADTLERSMSIWRISAPRCCRRCDRCIGWRGIGLDRPTRGHGSHSAQRDGYRRCGKLPDAPGSTPNSSRARPVPAMWLAGFTYRILIRQNQLPRWTPRSALSASKQSHQIFSVATALRQHLIASICGVNFQRMPELPRGPGEFAVV